MATRFWRLRMFARGILGEDAEDGAESGEDDLAKVIRGCSGWIRLGCSFRLLYVELFVTFAIRCGVHQSLNNAFWVC